MTKAMLQGPGRRVAGTKPGIFGLRRRPGRLVLAVFRLPLPMYRRGWGWLLGNTFLVVSHIGRRSGQVRDTAAMVLTYHPATREAVICSVWGENTDWIRNMRARPAVLAADADLPWRLRLVTAILGWDDLRSDAALRDFVGARPFVSLRPASTALPPVVSTWPGDAYTRPRRTPRTGGV